LLAIHGELSAAEVAEVLLAAYRSANLGKAVTLPLPRGQK
jgi:hypothetical protein